MTDQQAVSALKEILQIPSTTGEEQRVSQALQTLLEQNGIDCTVIEYAPGRPQLVAEIGSGQPVLAFSGHMDVVPVGETPWAHDPFSAYEQDGKLYARGATDMKAGLLAHIVAMIRLKQQGLPTTGRIRLLATVGEERCAVGAEQLFQLGYCDDIGALVIGEPTENAVCTGHKGALWLQVNTYGKTAHGSMPEQGINALEHMLSLIPRLRPCFAYAGTHELLGASTYSLNVLHSGNATNVIPDKCSLDIDIRTLPGQSHAQLLQAVQAVLDDAMADDAACKADVTVVNDLSPVCTHEADAFVQTALAASANVCGQAKPIFGMKGYTDASMFTQAKRAFPVVILGPGVSSLAHQPNEYVGIQSYLDAIQIYMDIATQYLQGGEVRT